MGRMVGIWSMGTVGGGFWGRIIVVWGLLMGC